MTASAKSSVVNWKGVWQLTSGIYYDTSKSTVKERLLEITGELQDGISQYKKCTTSGSDLEKLLQKKGQEKLFPFTYKLQQTLDLESEQCWEILCFYLVNEYRGPASSLSTFISSEMNMAKLLGDIWGFYCLERMICLKIVRNLLEYCRNPNHPYSEEYKEVLDKISLKKLRKSYIEQLDELTKEISTGRLPLPSSNDIQIQTNQSKRAERRSREINEILQILLLIVHRDGVEPEEFQKLFEFFNLHTFGRQQNGLDSDNQYHHVIKSQIVASDIILYLRCLDFGDSPSDENWIESVSKLIENTIMQTKFLPEDYGPILLSWMLLQFRRVESLEEDDQIIKYQKMGAKAVQLGVFVYLKKTLENQMFQDKSLVARIAKRTVYNHLNFLCEVFESNESIAQHAGMYTLLSELLSCLPNAQEFCRAPDPGGIQSLWHTALQNFPIEIVPICTIAKGVSNAAATSNLIIRQKLENIEKYAELYDGSKMKLLEFGDKYILNENYSPFKGIDYIIPAGTECEIQEKWNRSVVYIRTNVNFFDVLHNEINLLLSEMTQNTNLDENRLERVNAGFEYLICAVEKIKTDSEITQEMVHPIELSIDILNRLKVVQHPLVYKLLANCLNVCETLLPLFGNEILTRVINLNILPYTTNETLNDYKKYANGLCFESSLVGYFLINYEKKVGKYDFLIAYLKFVMSSSKLGKGKLFSLEIPGLVFMLREVFPHLHSWQFEVHTDKSKIYAMVLRHFLTVLQISNVDLQEFKTKRLLRDICVYSLLNLENGITLLKFVAVGNSFLQAAMENETNWMSPGSDGPTFLVQLSMTILMQTLRLKNTVIEKSTLSPLESIIYTQPKQRDTLRIIPVVTSYMNNIFNKRLPILSCRLLRRFAVEFKMSLLACLDMTHDQIRQTFLQCLPDELEHENLKTAILDFVESCLENQPGLTEAFFKLDYVKEKPLLFAEKKQTNIADSILTYMEEFLVAIENNPKNISSPVLSGIMSLFHSLWKNGLQILIKNLTEKPTFWTSLCGPLFSPTITKDVKAYSQLFNILGIEAFCLKKNSSKVRDDFQKAITNFLSLERFEQWIENILRLPVASIEDHVTDEPPEWLCRLQSFKDLMIILLRKSQEGIEVPDSSLKLLGTKILQELAQRAANPEDMRPVLVLSEFYLVVLTDITEKHISMSADEDKKMLDQIISLLNSMTLYYDAMHTRTKKACLSIVIRAADILNEQLTSDPIIAWKFFQPIVQIICLELSSLEAQQMNEANKNLTTVPTATTSNEKCLILSMNLIKLAALMFQKHGPSYWDKPIQSHQLIQRLLKCVSMELQPIARPQVCIECLDVLIAFAKGNSSDQFLLCKLGDFLWLQLLPPKDLSRNVIEIPPKEIVEKKGILLQNWWSIYARGIELVTILLETHRFRFLPEALMFAGIHGEYLCDAITLATQSLEPKAMNMIKNALNFVHELMHYKQQWRLEHSSSFFDSIKCTQIVLEHSISILYRTELLKLLVDKAPQRAYLSKQFLSSTLLTDEHIAAMNELVEICTTGTSILLKISPTLLELLTEPELLICKWEILMEIYFGAPKFDLGSYPSLTFGTLLNAINLFTKALNAQNHTFHEAVILDLPSETDEELSITTQTSRLCSATKRATFENISSSMQLNKSLSVSSTSYSNTPSSEILMNLDISKCLIALEHTLTLLATQTLLVLKNDNISMEIKQLIRREIKPGLAVHQDFERKKILTEYKMNWNRKKYGSKGMFEFLKESNQPDSAMDPQPAPSDRTLPSNLKGSMRVNVVRKQHLQQHRNPNNESNADDAYVMDMSRPLSPILGASSRCDLNVPTQATSTPAGEVAGATKRVAFTDDDNSNRKAYKPDDNNRTAYDHLVQLHSPLSFVRIVEEDYLHFLYNLLSFICQ